MNASFNSRLSEHLAELEERKARFAAAHPELGPMELRRSYWESACRRQGISDKQRRRNAERKEVNALIWLVKQSQPFWE